jgi:hypothetical protein
METMWLSTQLFETRIYVRKVETNGIGRFLGTSTRTRLTLSIGFAYKGWGRMRLKNIDLSIRRQGNLGNFEEALREKLENGGRDPFEFLRPCLNFNLLSNDTQLGKWKSMHCHPCSLLDGSTLGIGQNGVKWE